VAMPTPLAALPSDVLSKPGPQIVKSSTTKPRESSLVLSMLDRGPLERGAGKVRRAGCPGYRVDPSALCTKHTKPSRLPSSSIEFAVVSTMRTQSPCARSPEIEEA
jgi:hypothetical protein